ncbi:hypothetical protein LTR36_000799 [Oleoguttula mirabilis]|uniref:DASH complex subunit SPC34 n=1 Tax=Oleoguttula mirabilis TaxID=1507867 RepID=A0AAV9J3P3_9PEZI|nr:hypothetical protein LTR36_000799 [Oleoguttula mirabilis]
MPSLLTSHLDQIALCSHSIAQLPFPGPKHFTNALLSPAHDITALIRDTEAHERALFHLAPPPLPTKAPDFAASVNVVPTSTTAARRATAYGGARQPKSRAVAAVLGGDLYQKTRRAPADAPGRQRGDIDVEVLLEGAEKLAAVPIPGASDKIDALRRRHEQLAANIAHYEDRVSRNAQELQLMNRPASRASYAAAGEEDDEEEVVEAGSESVDDVEADATSSVPMTKADLQREEHEIRELERKKKGLEQRVTGMERDLGRLMR